MTNHTQAILLVLLVATAPIALAQAGQGPQRDCRDGLDNDGDGFSDLNDPGCASKRDRSELGAGPCDDGLDNDDDGTTDSGDPGCSSLTDTSELGASACDDGADNDGDGDTDFAQDAGCDRLTDATETREYADF